ncbi:MAG: type II toxin-antitoxin system VapC family toxin [Planctomycetes bacterium]|nr:type II toxin-antitoxin system VapC family toxin [Planctomycetota bacterium]
MFLDTSGLFSLLDKRSRFHSLAIELYRGADRLITHNYVLAELVALCNARKLPRPPCIQFIRGITRNPRVEMVWTDPILHEAGLDLISRRLDKAYSLCDAVSFVCMRQEGIASALTSDQHFEQEGFIQLLKC